MTSFICNHCDYHDEFRILPCLTTFVLREPYCPDGDSERRWRNLTCARRAEFNAKLGSFRRRFVHVWYAVYMVPPGCPVAEFNPRAALAPAGRRHAEL